MKSENATEMEEVSRRRRLYCVYTSGDKYEIKNDVFDQQEQNMLGTKNKKFPFFCCTSTIRTNF